MTGIIIYTGPSLSPDTAESILPQADIRPPIRRGDLTNAMKQKPDLIGIIDGELYTAPTVSPTEILNILTEGVVVLGGAGIGALRATELFHYGMIGIGTVFHWYRNEELYLDDAVFTKYDRYTYRRMSDPLVNMIFTFSAAEYQGIISSNQRNLLLDIAKMLYFSKRTYSAVLAESEVSLTPKNLKDLQEFILNRGIDIQKRDAICLLQGAKYYLNNPGKN